MMACWWLDHLDEVIAQIRAVESVLSTTAEN
jgi:hypothetical protein